MLAGFPLRGARSRQLGQTAYFGPHAGGTRRASLGRGTTVQRAPGVIESWTTPRGTDTGFPLTSTTASVELSFTIRYHAPRRSVHFTSVRRRAHWNCDMEIPRADRDSSIRCRPAGHSSMVAAPFGGGRIALDAEDGSRFARGNGGDGGPGPVVAVPRVGSDLQPRAQGQLLEDAVHVALDRADGDAEALRDLLVAQTTRNQFDDLAPPPGEPPRFRRLRRAALERSFRDVRKEHARQGVGKDLCACCHRANGSDQLVERGLFQDEARNPRFHE